MWCFANFCCCTLGRTLTDFVTLECCNLQEGQSRSELLESEEGFHVPMHQEEATQPASANTAIAEDNRGFKMLQKMGWTSGSGLGKHEDGILP